MTIKDLIKVRNKELQISDIDLKKASDAEMEMLSTEMGMGLSLDEMKRVRDYFMGEGRNPSDVELQAFGQAWSEHCCYKSSKPFLKKYVFGIDNKNVIDRGDAGIMNFDDEHAYALRVESHNHPSALEPYGGAATGIGGIVRDVLCMGAQPIALVDPLFFGPLDFDRSKLPQGLKHPKYLMGGVVAGIRDYGNRIGIPTVAGTIFIHDGYTGNCLVNVGCIGIGAKKDIRRNRVKNPDDVFVLVGGRTGRDGIHGVTFASRVLTERSEGDRGAVQLGDPIMKEPVIHAVLQVNEMGLVQGMKDLGGGGLSCVVGELALAGGYGAYVDLEKVPTKEEGLAPWEMWVSESQERMMLAVQPADVEKVLAIFELWDVPATVIGHVIPEKRVKAFYKGARIIDVDLEFLTGGPVYDRPIKPPSGKGPKEKKPKAGDLGKALKTVLADPNIASKDWVIRQYDHEVRGRTAIKPLQGTVMTPCHGDAAVLKPLEGSFKGLAIAVSSNPIATQLNPYNGGAGIIDEICRNLVAVGARPDALTDCLNYGNPEIPERLYYFAETVRGIGDVCKFLNLVIPSGNVSFYNESPISVVPPTAVVVGCGLVKDVRKAVTSDVKEEGTHLLLVGGPTTSDMGGSEYFRIMKGHSTKVPGVDMPLLKASIDALVKASEGGLVASCHDISHGGLAVCLSEMCMGGDIGATVDIKGIGSATAKADERLFNEANTRWVVEVREKSLDAFTKKMGDIKVKDIGKVGGRSLAVNDGSKKVLSLPVGDMYKVWSRALWDMMG